MELGKEVTNVGANISVILEFEAIFSKEFPQKPEQYLRGGRKDDILRVAAFFLGFKNDESKFDDHVELLQVIFGEDNNGLANEIYERIKIIENRGFRIVIINAYSSLKLFEYFFQRNEEPETQTKSEFEINIFKAYLLFNSELSAKQDTASASAQKAPEQIRLAMLNFCWSYPISDKINYSMHQVWITQAIKATFLFQFLESNLKTRPLLEKFLDRFKCPTWQEYLKRLLSLTTSALKEQREAHTDIIVSPDENYEANCDFIENLIVQEKEELDENDFITLRAKPFYKIKRGYYRIIFKLFVVEKIFKGVYFLLRDVNEALPKSIKIPNLKSFFGDQFSERILLYKVIRGIYPDKCISFSGDDLKMISGAPDYYIRKHDNILIFECKDFLIPARSKESFDYAIYENEFEKKLYFENREGREIPKAVMQLIGFIKKILKKEFRQDNDYDLGQAYIYPILITHDHQFDAPGFNDLIDYWFRAELDVLESEGFYVKRIKSLVVINIDTLIYHQLPLQESKLLHNMINEFFKKKKNKSIVHKLVKRSQTENDDLALSKLIPFSSFIDREFTRDGLLKHPPVLEILGKSLFPDEFFKSKYG